MLEELFEKARAARLLAYAPYSKFQVGAAIRTASGRIFTGANVENLSYGLTICAERAAVFAAVHAGERDFEAIAIVADTSEPISPCGACRQVLAEFSPAMMISSEARDGTRFTASLTELLPRAKTGILDVPSA